MEASQSALTPPTQVKKYKIVFLGDMGVGKTSIINQFMHGTFNNSHQPTIGIDCLSKTMQLEDRSFRLQVWDTAGQERFRTLIRNYIRDCSVAIIAYDITQNPTFLGIDKWVEDVKNERGGDVVIMICGNKIDLNSQRTVTSEEGQAKANSLNVLFVEVSAKTGANIKTLFENVARALPGLNNAPTQSQADQTPGQIKLTPGAQSKPSKGGCKC
ncbi:unnamed protein product [Blepharisma stoltei]|uniref:Uncharacterized protein n=1 Tax=Blepharisma stoltei TaxID=1481888 RepID=A0AAU9KI90_9CILI|nr:unnamed protein product [Blepharisma stoltei]